MDSYVIYGHSHDEVNKEFDKFINRKNIHIKDIINLSYDEDNKRTTFSIKFSVNK